MAIGSFVRGLLAAVLLGTAFVAPAQQKPRMLDVPATMKWQHAATGLIVPQELAGLPRTAITDSSSEEIDVAAQFGNTETTQLTLYIFRPALWNVPVWFDRVETQVLNREAYGHAVPSGEAIAFAPPKTSTTSALRRAYVPGKPPFKATAAAMIPLPEWLVAIRISSASLDAAALDAKLVGAINGLGWPAPVSGTAALPTAVPVRPCETSLKFAKKAKLKKPDMMMSLLGATLASVAQNATDEDKAQPAQESFCREGDPGLQFAAYRSLGEGEGYLIAFGDAGQTISVYPELPIGEGRPGYAVTFNGLSESLVYPSFDKLPLPARVLDMVQKTSPISSSTRGSKTIDVNVGS